VSGVLSAFSFPAARRFTLEGLVSSVTDAGFSVLQAELVPGLLPIGFVVATPSQKGP
jgi:hypothetical protein